MIRYHDVQDSLSAAAMDAQLGPSLFEKPLPAQYSSIAPAQARPAPALQHAFVPDMAALSALVLALALAGTLLALARSTREAAMLRRVRDRYRAFLGEPLPPPAANAAQRQGLR